MPPTRIPTAALQAAASNAQQLIRQAIDALKPFAVQLTDDERASTLRARAGFPEGARALVRAMERHPDLASTVQFDAQAVQEDLDNIQALQPLRGEVAILEQMLADSHLSWTAEALVPSLAAYRVAKAAAATQGDLKAVTDPMASVFATTRERKP